MTAPPLLIGVVFLFWGLQTGYGVVGVLMAVVMEAVRLAPRLELTPRDFQRVSYFSTAAAAGIAIYAYATQTLPGAVAMAVQWFPVACTPLLVAQRLGAAQRVPVASLLPVVSKRFGARFAQASVDLTYPLFAACVLAASTANSQTNGFFAGMLILTAYALWAARPRYGRVAVWFLGFALAAGLGYMGQMGLHQAQGHVERAFSGYVPGSGPAPDGARTTAIGSIGKVKLSARIALRVRSAGAPPRLLHAATFTAYSAGVWVAPASRFSPLTPESIESSRVWKLGESPGAARRVTIDAGMPGGAGLLPLPEASTAIEGFPYAILSRNSYADVRVDDGPGLASYAAIFDGGSSSTSDAASDNADTFVQPGLRPLFDDLARQLRLSGMTAREKAETVTRFFEENFTYSLYQAPRDPDAEPLADFLTRTHAGHCEYFATSTVLLLRAAGVPARYVTGYAVIEWSDREQAWVVRDRHAHAWTRVFLDGRWQDLDTTPPSWSSIEAEEESRWRPIQDWLSWVWYRFRMAISDRAAAWIHSAGWLLPAAVVASVIGLLRFFLKRRKRATPASAQRVELTGADSEFYRIETLLDRAGFGRRAGETALKWLQRLEATAGPAISIEPLRAALSLHYRHRFDPEGLGDAERSELRVMVDRWLLQHRHLRRTGEKLFFWWPRNRVRGAVPEARGSRWRRRGVT